MKPVVMQTVLLVGMLALPMGASAQHVYKCVDGDHVAYQSEPCGSSATRAKQWNATPEPPPDAAELQRRALALQQGKRESDYLRSLARRSTGAARKSRASGATIFAARDGKGCAEAKRKRDAAEARIGLKRTYQSLQASGNRVYEACR